MGYERPERRRAMFPRERAVFPAGAGMIRLDSNFLPKKVNVPRIREDEPGGKITLSFDN